MLQFLFEWIQNHVLLSCIIAFWIYKFYQASLPFPKVKGPKVRSISSMKAFEDALLEGKKHGKRVICDFYATWCPPCKVAAPIYGNLSKEHTNVLFLKVNVDEARDVARSCDISAMPTFKSYAEGKETGSCQGWNEAKVLAMIKGD